MANVLGELFGNIATAIREKTGDTATMKPAEFPEKIRGIEVGSDPVVQSLVITENGTYTAPDGVDGYSPITVNVSASSDGTYTRYTGSFLASSAIQTVTHKCNEVPDMLIVSLDGVPAAGYVFLAIGYSQAMLDKLGGGYLTTITAVGAAGGAMQSSTDKGIEDANEGYYANYGGLRSVTDSQFTIGGTTFGLEIGKYYSYEAICGLV